MAYITLKNPTTFILKKQVVRVEKLVGQKNKFKDIAFKRQNLLNERKRFEEKERKLEDTTDSSERQVSTKMPVKKLGFLDVVKNFLFKVLLGAFAIKLLPHAPKLKGVLVGAMKFSDFILQFSGALLNSFVTFVDKVYQIVDFGKKQAKLLGGDKGLQNYEKALGTAKNVMNSMLIAGMLFSDLIEIDSQSGVQRQAVDTIQEKVTQEVVKRQGFRASMQAIAQRIASSTVGVVGLVGLASSLVGELLFQQRKFTTKLESDAYKKVEEAQKDPNLITRSAKLAFYNTFAIPGLRFYNFLSTGIGTLLDIIGAPFRYAVELINFAVMSLMGDSKGIRTQRENLGKLDARIREQLRQMVNVLSFGLLAKKKGSFGSLYGKGATEAMGYAEGGEVTRGGMYMGAVTRTAGKGVKARRTEVISTSPLQPGVDVGGLSPYQNSTNTKISTFYQNFSDVSITNPYEYLEKSYDIVGTTKFVHPLLEMSVKTLMGDKPPESDFKAVGVGLNNLLNDILDTAKSPDVKGGVISDKTGPIDISNWISSIVKDAITDPINSIISNLSNQLTLKANSTQGGAVSPSAQKVGDTQENPLAQFGGQAQFVIGDSIAHGFAGRSGKGTDSDDTQVGRSAANVLKILKAKGDALQGKLIDLSTGIANSKDDFSSVESQLSYLKSIGAKVRVLGVSDTFSQKNGGINEKLNELVRKYGFYFYGGFRGGKDQIHGTAEDYSKLKQKREVDTAPTSGAEGMGGLDLGKGYGSLGSKIAGELGRYVQKLGVVPGSIHEHPEFGGVLGRHAANSYHYQGRAIDLGAYAYEQGPILAAIAEFNKMKGVKPVQLLHARNEPSEHSDHVHVAYEHGGLIRKTDYAVTHPGEYVVDADSVKLFGIPFYDLINKTETVSQRKRASESLISMLSQYTEDGFPETEEDYMYHVPEQPITAVVPPRVLPSPPKNSSYISGSEDPSKDILFM